MCAKCAIALLHTHTRRSMQKKQTRKPESLADIIVMALKYTGKQYTKEAKEKHGKIPQADTHNASGIHSGADIQQQHPRALYVVPANGQ